MQARGEVLRFEPTLPPEVKEIKFSVHYRGHRVDVALAVDHMEVRSRPGGASAYTVRAWVGDQIYRPARFPGDVGGAVHHMRAVVRIPQTMADRSGHLAARSARTWARLRAVSYT